MRIGLISDTHGLLRPEALTALDGVDLILHAGDVGGRDVLRGLRRLAPVQAVFGNVDDEADPDLRPRIQLSVAGCTVHVSHGHELRRPTPEGLLRQYTADVLVFGHTHRALVHQAGARMVINPGAAGPRRFDVRPSVARLVLEDGRAEATVVWL
jgi:putative phosphoesterase